MYSLSSFGEMITDRVRTAAYAEALRRTVRPGSVVLEIGTGPGIFAILACQLGARRVFAIESEEIIQVAREHAASNGCAGRIEFIEDFSTHVTLSEKADVIISDLRGVLPLYTRLIPSLVDARRRFLAPGGVLIPRHDILRAVVVEMPGLYESIVEPWEHNLLDIGFGSARRLAVNDVRKVYAKPQQLLTAPQIWATLNYSTIESPDVSGELCWSIERDGIGHGIDVWFDTEMADGVSFSNSPGAPETIYGSLFFPWMHPVKLARGDRVCVKLEAKLAENDYIWRWNTRVESSVSSGRVVDQFDQSLLAASVISPVRLRKVASGFIPQLSEDALLDREILELMDGKLSLEEISRRLAADYPQRFARWEDALPSASALSRKYSR